MPNYKRSKIYKLVSDETENCYIGSTTKRLLCERMAVHSYDYRTWVKDSSHAYISSYKILKYEDCKIILLEKYPCEDKDELLARERYWIERTPNAINKTLPGRSKKEYGYYYDNLPEVKLKKKQWAQDNKDKLKATRDRRKDKLSQWQKTEVECGCGSTYTKTNKSQHEKSKKHKAWEEENE